MQHRGAVRLAGVSLAWDATVDDEAESFFAQLAAMLPPHEGRADIEVRLGPPGLSLPSDVRPLFFHGPVQVSARGDQHWVHDGESSILLEGGLIRGDVAPSSAFPELLLRVMLFTALRAHGVHELHAGALRVAGVDALVVGESGAGKTTFVLAAVLGGAAHGGDDTTLLRREGDRVVASSFPRAFLVAPRTLAAFEVATAARTATLHAGKRALDPERVGGQRALPELTPSRLLFPRVVDRDGSAIVSVSQADALGGLVASSPLAAVRDAPRRAENFSMLTDLARSCAGFEVLLGRDLLASPRATTDRLLAELRAAER